MTPPFVNPPTTIGGRWGGGKAARCFWVKPELVAQVRFSAWTRDGGLRAPVFKGLRADIDPRSVRREDAGAQPVDVIADDAAARPGDDVDARGRVDRRAARRRTRRRTSRSTWAACRSS